MKKFKFKIALAIICSVCFFGYVMVSSYMPNDTYVGMQWAVKNTGNNIPGGYQGVPDCDMDVDSAWQITLGSDKVLISLVDSGVDTLHEDLVGNLVPGYNFLNNNTNVFDVFGHGTPAAGIIGGIGNNNKGISGISPICKIMPIKITDSQHGTGVTDQIITDAIAYSWQRGQWISVMEFAWSPISAANQTIIDGVTYGRNGKGTVFVTGTGNNNNDSIAWPSSNPCVISVGGITPCNTRKFPNTTCGGMGWGSCYGEGIDVVAPCIRIYATDITGSAGQDTGKYTGHYWGTSAAMPNVAGVVALMFAVDSTLRWDSVRAILCRTAEKVGAYNYNQLGPLPQLGYTWNPEMGYGKVNAYYALKEVVAGLNKLTIELIPQGFYNNEKLNMRDTVKVYLKSAAAPYAILDSAKSIIDSNTFKAKLIFTQQKPVSYYITLKHRNSIETWSKINSDNSFYSFTSDQSQAYGDNLVEVDDSPLLYGIYSGDVNNDGTIDLDDINIIQNDSHNFVTGYVNTDVTGDKVVDFDDVLLAYYNSNNFISKLVP